MILVSLALCSVFLPPTSASFSSSPLDLISTEPDPSELTAPRSVVPGTTFPVRSRTEHRTALTEAPSRGSLRNREPKHRSGQLFDTWDPWDRDSRAQILRGTCVKWEPVLPGAGNPFSAYEQ